MKTSHSNTLQVDKNNQSSTTNKRDKKYEMKLQKAVSRKYKKKEIAKVPRKRGRKKKILENSESDDKLKKVSRGGSVKNLGGASLSKKEKR